MSRFEAEFIPISYFSVFKMDRVFESPLSLGEGGVVPLGNGAKAVLTATGAGSFGNIVDFNYFGA